MKSEKGLKAQSSYDDRRSKFWVKGVNQTSSPCEEKAFAVCQPDILVTSQYLATYRRRFHLQPEQVLMLAVLEDAVVCFQENVTAVQPRKQALFREAEDWILDDDKRYFFIREYLRGSRREPSLFATRSEALEGGRFPKARKPSGSTLGGLTSMASAF